MKISLDYLINHQIQNQHNSLHDKSNGQSLPKGYRIEKCKKYEISAPSQLTQETDQLTQETAQSIFVNIVMEGNPIETPKGAFFCGGAKGAITLVEVAVCPPNQSIQDRVVEFLKNQKTPPAMMSGPMVVYDKITINGEVIR